MNFYDEDDYADDMSSGEEGENEDDRDFIDDSALKKKYKRIRYDNVSDELDDEILDVIVDSDSYAPSSSYDDDTIASEEEDLDDDSEEDE